MKKFLLLFFLLIFISIVPVQASEKVVLQIGWSSGVSYDNLAFEKMLSSFSEQNPNIIVKQIDIEPWDYFDGLYGRSRNENTMDIFILNNYLLTRYSDKLTDLKESPYQAGLLKKSIVPYAWEKAIDEKGHLVGFPLTVMPNSAYYRKDIFKKVGVDIRSIKNLGDLYAAAKKITRDTNGDGIIDQHFIITGMEISYLILQSNSKALVSKTGEKWILDTERIKTAISWGRKFSQNGIDYPRYLILSTLNYYKDGSIAYDISNPILANILDEQAKK